MIKIYPGFWLQALLSAISPLGVLGYYYYFRIRLAAAKKRKLSKKSNLLLLNLIVGIPTAWMWIIMPFLKQPRFLGLVGAIQGEKEVSTIGLITSSLGVCMAFFSFIFLIMAEIANMKVTQKNYSSPEILLKTGSYGIIRHPIITITFFFILGLCLVTGTYYTTIFIPVYFIICHFTGLIEEKYALEPKFSEELREYKKNTPKYFTWWLTLLLVLGIIAVIANYLYVEVRL